MSSNKVRWQWILTMAFTDLPIFCDQRMLDFEDAFGQRLASPNVLTSKMGSMPLVTPAIAAMLPVGGIVRSVTLRSPFLSIFSMSSGGKSLKKGFSKCFAALKTGKGPFSAAMFADSS